MPMSANDLINAIIDDGIHEISTTYLRLDQKDKRDGGIAGFEACRGKRPDELIELVAAAKNKTHQAREENATNYWYHVMYERQIEWVINVYSAAQCANDLEPLVSPTAHGYRKAIDILGIKT